jgi:ribosomal-protein-alanine N-acetyltransferase
MELDDVPQVSEIEREAFPLPWPATNFRRELTSSSLTHFLVACREWSETTEIAPQLAPPDTNLRNMGSQFERLTSGFARIFRREMVQVAPSQLILGFAAVWFMADEAHLANIAVREACRQQGVGEHLLISVIRLAVERGARFITLEVRASNQAAQALYAKYGFDEVGIRHGYYSDNGEDAVLMTAEAVGTEHFREGFLRMSRDYTRKRGIEV